MITRHVVPWLLGGFLVLVLALAAFGPRARVTKIAALVADAPPWNETSFREHSYYGDSAGIPPDLATRGSRVDGADAWQGEFLSGWFNATPHVKVFVTGYPQADGNRLEIEARSAAGELVTMPFDRFNPRESWSRWDIALPENATAFRIRAVDRTAGLGGWLAVSEPFVGRLHPTLLPQAPKTLIAFAIQASLFALLSLLLTRALRLEKKFESPTVALLAGAVVAALGYLVFWVYFFHPLAGRILSWSLCFGATFAPFIRRRSAVNEWPLFQPAMLAALIGTFYITLLSSFESPSLSFSAANRFVAQLPADNEIPRVFAERLWKGESTHALFGEWLSSDRPPLQTGWLLITWPVLDRLGFDSDTSSAAAGVCFQLLWVPAVMALVFHLGANARQSLAVTATLAFNGVFLIYSIFVWPKFGAAALVIGCYLLVLNPQSRRLYFATAGGCAALGWLAHGGVAFSLLGLAPLAFMLRRAAGWRCWVMGALVFAAFTTPWIAYQRWYDPPGDRLLKWHLAGVIPVDSRSIGQTLRDQYRQTPIAELVRNRWENTQMLFGGQWLVLPSSPEARQNIRTHEMQLTVRAWCFWLLAWAVPLVGWWFPKTRDTSRSRQRTLLAWLALSVAAWILLMFLPASTIVHQGTLVTQLGSFTLLAWWALDCRRSLFLVLALAQTAWFAAVWTPAGLKFEGSLDPSAGTIAVLTGTLLLGVIVWAALSSPRRGVSSPAITP